MPASENNNVADNKRISLTTDIKHTQTNYTIKNNDADDDGYSDQKVGSEDLSDGKEVELNVDRGYAWLVVCGGTATFFVTGFTLAWGIIQDIYLKNGVFPGSHDATTQLTLVGSAFQGLQLASVVGCNLLYGRLGPRKLTVIGSLLMFIGFITTAQATSIWNMILSLSILTSFGLAMQQGRIICNITSLIYFYPIAFGIITSSNPLSGLVLPFIITQVYSHIGHQWIFRVLAFISLGTSAISIAFLKEQKRPKNTDQEKSNNSKPKKNFDINVLKNTQFLTWMINGPLAMSGRLLVYTFLPSHGTQIGLSDYQIAAVSSIASGIQIIGRICIGMLADRIGHVNVYLISMAVSTISILVIWMLANNFASLVGFSIVFGLFGGTYMIVNPPILASTVGMEGYPSALNFSVIANLLSIPIPPIISSVGGAKNSSNNDPFLPYKIAAGGLYGLCALLAVLLKLRRNKNIFAKV
ncbi:major facilitator superfamily domain-containing protein [Phascolomyces articulosus]|uniref:Major facilitator superfamily domain-containing protein n=1 Tax=Phascolomyces articulosus TaxID=60185 RepID=A0AAD5K5S4_9FUNG|nr:major facilitator superfamily domain-containing protein [Phascolomyces articulosus]